MVWLHDVMQDTSLIYVTEHLLDGIYDLLLVYTLGTVICSKYTFNGHQ